MSLYDIQSENWFWKRELWNVLKAVKSWFYVTGSLALVLAFENNILYKQIILFLLISILGQVDFILVLSKSKGPGDQTLEHVLSPF